ncbi:MAG: acyl--CoA ligase [Patulibacter sp.]|nr:acyl--CoA ligase [Patulibacter sp.]
MSTETPTGTPATAGTEPDHLDPGLTVPAFIRRVCERSPDRPALVFEGETWSFRRLADEIDRMQAALLGLGAGKGTRVGVLMGMRPEWVVATFAAMGIGAVAVPISTYEPAKQRHELLRQADVAILVLQDRMLRNAFLDDLLDEVPTLTSSDADPFDVGLPYLRHVIHLGSDRSAGRLLSWNDALDRAPTLPAGYVDALQREIHPTDDALIIHTSGTSGAAKGVIHGHRSIAIQFDRLPGQFTMTADDVVWGSFPLFWSAGIAWLLGASLAAGAPLVLQERFERTEALDLVERHRATFALATPLQLDEMLDALDEHPADLSSLRVLPRGRLADHLGMPDDAVFGGASLGLTETLTLAASIPWDSPVELRRTTHGRALPGTLIKIVDPETGADLPVGERGEIALKGTTLMKGYNKRFPETYLDADGYYRTGDAGHLDEDGYLHWTGRMAHLIRTNSANVSPAEVEAALYALPEIKIAAAIGAPDPDYGEVVVACVVLKDGAELLADDVRVRLRGELAGYKIPRHVLFFAEAELEMTATGKLRLENLRKLVTERLAAPAA